MIEKNLLFCLGYFEPREIENGQRILARWGESVWAPWGGLARARSKLAHSRRKLGACLFTICDTFRKT